MAAQRQSGSTAKLSHNRDAGRESDGSVYSNSDLGYAIDNGRKNSNEGSMAWQLDMVRCTSKNYDTL